MLWWDDKCKDAVKNRNKAFKIVKRTHSFQAMLLYKQNQAVVRRTGRRNGHTGGRIVTQLVAPHR